MEQTKKESFVESIVNTITSLIGTYASQAIVFPMLEIEASEGQLWASSLIFAIMNTIKIYIIRRFFVRRKVRKLNK